jgi:hypothetical protein
MNPREKTVVEDIFLDERDIARITKRSLASVRRDRLFGRGCPYVKINASVRYKESEALRYFDSLPRHGGGGQL